MKGNKHKELGDGKKQTTCLDKAKKLHWSEQMAYFSVVVSLSLLFSFCVVYTHLKNTGQINPEWVALKAKAKAALEPANDQTEIIPEGIVRFRVTYSGNNISVYENNLYSFDSIFQVPHRTGSRIQKCTTAVCQGHGEIFDILQSDRSDDHDDEISSEKVYFKLIEHLTAGVNPNLTAIKTIERVCDNKYANIFNKSCFYEETECQAPFFNNITTDFHCNANIFGIQYGWGAECQFSCKTDAGRITGDSKRVCQRRPISKKLFWSNEGLVCVKKVHCTEKSYFKFAQTNCPRLNDTASFTGSYTDAFGKCQNDISCKGISDLNCTGGNFSLCGAVDTWMEEARTGSNCVWAKPAESKMCYQVAT